jgi:hypothetical protein
MHADKIDVEEKPGNQDILKGLNCLMLRKIKDTSLEAKSKGKECIVSIVRNEELLF